MPIGPVMLDIESDELQSQDEKILREPLVGGVILFARNYTTRERLVALVDSIRAINPDLLIAVDHEGGRVQRFREGFSKIPPMSVFAEKMTAVKDTDESQQVSIIEMVQTIGWLMAAELRAVGIDFSFAPVLDIEKGLSRVIGDRAFGTDPDTVVKLAGAWIEGMHSAGMAATGKHFPGHGSVEADSHLEIPVDDRTLEQVEQWDLLPFKNLVKSHLDAIMPAHVIYASIEPNPAGFSTFWLQSVLREKLGFQGVIFSDDLSMAGAEFAGSYYQRALRALEAGCDMALVCNNRDGALEVIEGLKRHEGFTANPTLERMRGQGNYHWDDLLKSPRWIQARKILDSLN
ncbi:MAG: beta-N-acetylhexosaminidase [Pseudomonadales bacterium]|nr:beta-N-acetylhexosaminidase [Pseudomonadales bacterium]